MDRPTPLSDPSTRAAGPASGDVLAGDAASLLVARLIDVVRLRDSDLAGHGQRAAHVAAAIAMELGLDTATIDRTYLGAQLHDIGKLGVAEAVLWKPAGLNRGEWTQIRTHPEKGHRLVAGLVHRDVAAAVLSHHERLDGSGYPHGIAARTLPITVRIVQVADAYDAMTSDRPYDRALASELAIAEIRRCAGTQFDPDAAAALASLLAIGFEDDSAIDISTPELIRAAPSGDPFAAIA